MTEPEDFAPAYYAKAYRAFEGLRALGRRSSARAQRLLEILNVKDLDAFMGICEIIIRKDVAYDEDPR